MHTTAYWNRRIQSKLHQSTSIQPFFFISQQGISRLHCLHESPIFLLHSNGYIRTVWVEIKAHKQIPIVPNYAYTSEKVEQIVEKIIVKCLQAILGRGQIKYIGECVSNTKRRKKVIFKIGIKINSYIFTKN